MKKLLFYAIALCLVFLLTPKISYAQQCFNGGVECCVLNAQNICAGDTFPGDCNPSCHDRCPAGSRMETAGNLCSYSGVPPPPGSGAGIVGSVDGYTCNPPEIYGWAVRTQDGAGINARAWINAVQLPYVAPPGSWGTDPPHLLTNTLRSDINAYYGLNADGLHGFSFSFPAEWIDGLSRQVKVGMSGSSQLFGQTAWNSPITITCAVCSPVNGVCSAWSAWSACSACSQTHTRTYTPPNACGSDVACSPLSESQACGAVNGACSDPDTHYTCSAGTSASNVSGATAWTWGCNGLCSGSNASPSCSENKPVNGACSNPDAHYTCSAGTSADNVSGATAWTWGCNGLYGGTNASCSENKPTTPVGTCGSFSDLTCTTPVTWTWANGTGLQATFDYAPETNPLAQYWLYNSAATSPKTFNSILTGHTAYGRTTYDYIYFSSTANKTCTIPTLSAPTLTCGSFNEAGVYTPVTATWANGTALQVTRGLPPATQTDPSKWLYNAAAASGIVITPPAGKYMPPGEPPEDTIYARTYYDCGGSTFSATSSITCDPPANPDPATIQGDLQQKSGTGCYTADASHTFYINSISTTTSNGCVISVCKANPPVPPNGIMPNPAATDYNCAITFDGATCLNQDPPTWPTSATVNLTGATTTNPGFSFTGWTDPPGTCQTAPTNSILVAAGSSTTKNLTFNFLGDRWLKAKDTSFNPSSTTGTTAVSIPIFANPFPASNDTGTPYFIIGQAGSALGVSVLPSTAYSTPNNWNDSGYSHTPAMSATNFISYIKSRKNYQPISDLAPTTITADGVYLWTGGTLTINDLTNLDHNIVLMSSGEIIIDKEPFISPSSKSLTIVANIITFNNSVYKANGIFIANTINTGTASQGLQIVGNLNALYTFNNDRSWSDTSIPSIFVEFDPVQYINLLPYLSTASYDWRQIQ